MDISTCAYLSLCYDEILGNLIVLAISTCAYMWGNRVVGNQGYNPIFKPWSYNVIYDATGMSGMSNDVWKEMSGMSHDVAEIPAMSSDIREEC